VKGSQRVGDASERREGTEKDEGTREILARRCGATVGYRYGSARADVRHSTHDDAATHDGATTTSVSNASPMLEVALHASLIPSKLQAADEKPSTKMV